MQAGCSTGAVVFFVSGSGKCFKKIDKWTYKGSNTVLGVTVKYKHDVDMF